MNASYTPKNPMTPTTAAISAKKKACIHAANVENLVIDAASVIRNIEAIVTTSFSRPEITAEQLLKAQSTLTSLRTSGPARVTMVNHAIRCRDPRCNAARMGRAMQAWELECKRMLAIEQEVDVAIAARQHAVEVADLP